MEFPDESPFTVVIVQGRDVVVQATAAETRELLTAAWRSNEPARFKLFDGEGDVLINEQHVGAIFVPEEAS